MNNRLARLENALGSLKARITMGGIMALVLGIGVITTILVGRTEHDLLQESQRQHEMSEAVRTAGLLGHNVVQLQRVLQSVAEVLDEPRWATRCGSRNSCAPSRWCGISSPMCTWPRPTATCR
jgi:hypothetical protein